MESKSVQLWYNSRMNQEQSIAPIEGDPSNLPKHIALDAVINLASKPEALTMSGWASVVGLHPQAARIIGGYIKLLQLAKQVRNKGVEEISLLPKQVHQDIARMFVGFGAFPPGQGIGGVERVAAEAILGAITMSYAYKNGIPPVVREENTTMKADERRQSLLELVYLDPVMIPASMSQIYQDERYEEWIGDFFGNCQGYLKRYVQAAFQEKSNIRKDERYINAARSFLNLLLHSTDRIFQDVPTEEPGSPLRRQLPPGKVIE